VNRGRTNPTCPPTASCAVAGLAKHSNMITAAQKVTAMVLSFLSVLNIFLSISFLSSLIPSHYCGQHEMSHEMSKDRRSFLNHAR
jgi:hypothetical protein